MSFNTLAFIAFLGISLLLYYIVPKRFRWVALLFVSCVYYILNSSILIVFMLITTLSIYLCGLWLGKINSNFNKIKSELSKDEKKLYKAKMSRNKKLVVFAAVVVNFGILFFLKYFNFMSDTVGSVAGIFNTSYRPFHLDLVLPLGISFYTLQAVSYVVDVYRGKVKADKNLGRVALFLMFFPQIMEGPIGRYDHLAHQLYNGHSFDFENFKRGWQLILWGMFKKMVIADRAGIFVDNVFMHYQDYSGMTVVFGIILYTLQIYTDFSGSIDIVTGVAQLFGIELAENFRRPFFSLSVQEFWRRWHITLGAWLRDYIFYPISFSKFFMNFSKNTREKFNDYLAKIIPMAFSMFFVWFGNGIWHGSSIKYIVYGLYYYVLIMIGVMCEPLIRATLKTLHINREANGYKLFQMLRTTVLVCIGMMIFRAKDLYSAYSMFVSMFVQPSLSVITNSCLFKDFGIYESDFVILGIGFIILLVVGIMQEKGICIRDALAKKNIVLRWAVYYVGIFMVLLFGTYGIGYKLADLIYAQF